MNYDDYQHLVVTVEDGVAVVRMNRPEKLNAFNRTMGIELLRVPGELRDDPAVRCVVLTGTGRGFCSGVDVTGERDPAVEDPFTRRPVDELGFSGRLTLAWNEIDVPSIASINGVAAGGGLGLALMQDLRIAAESARLLPMFAMRGMSPQVGLGWTATRLLGVSRTLDWLYRGRPLVGHEALEWGVVNYVVPDDELEAETMVIAREIAEGAPIALRLTRRTVHHAAGASLRDHLIYEVMHEGISAATEDTQEGRAAVNERRKPVFKGR